MCQSVHIHGCQRVGEFYFIICTVRGSNVKFGRSVFEFAQDLYWIVLTQKQSLMVGLVQWTGWYQIEDIVKGANQVLSLQQIISPVGTHSFITWCSKTISKHYMRYHAMFKRSETNSDFCFEIKNHSKFSVQNRRKQYVTFPVQSVNTTVGIEVY